MERLSDDRRSLSTLQGGIDFVINFHDTINREIASPGLRSRPPLAQRFFILHKSAQRLGKLFGLSRLDQLTRFSMSEKLRGSAYRGGNDRATRLACLRNHETAGVGIGGQDKYLRLPQQRLRRLDRAYEMRRSRESEFPR